MKNRVSTLALSVAVFGVVAIFSSSVARAESDYFFTKDPSGVKIFLEGSFNMNEDWRIYIHCFHMIL